MMSIVVQQARRLRRSGICSTSIHHVDLLRTVSAHKIEREESVLMLSHFGLFFLVAVVVVLGISLQLVSQFSFTQNNDKDETFGTIPRETVLSRAVNDKRYGNTVNTDKHTICSMSSSDMERNFDLTEMKSKLSDAADEVVTNITYRGAATLVLVDCGADYVELCANLIISAIRVGIKGMVAVTVSSVVCDAIEARIGRGSMLHFQCISQQNLFAMAKSYIETFQISERMANVGYRSKKRGNLIVLMLTRMLLYWRVLEKKSTDLLVLDADVAILKYPFDTMSGEFDVMSSWGGGHAIDSRNVTLNHCSSQTDMHRIELKINDPPLVRCVSLGPPLYFKASLSYILEFVVMKYMIKPENVQKDFVDVVMDILILKEILVRLHLLTKLSILEKLNIHVLI